MFRLMIAEDNLNITLNYQKFLTKEENIKIIAKTNDGENTIKLYKELKPDLLILDLGLPKVNGLEIINQLSAFEEKEKKCNIIVASGNNDLRNHLFNTKKVYRIIPKPISYDFLLDTIKSFINEQNTPSFPTQRLIDILLQLNLNPYSDSGSYLIDTISLAYSDTHLLNNMQNIYNIIAIRNNCNNQKIKSSIRSSIRTANRFADSELLCSIFFMSKNNYNQILSPKHFVSCMVNYLNSSS